MNRITGLNCFLGILLAGSTVVADDVNLATGQHASVAMTRRAALDSSTPASAMEAASATTVGTNRTSPTLATNALPPLPPGVSELRFNDFFRQPIGPRGLEYTDQLRSLEGRRIRILGYMVRQTKPVAGCFLFAPRPVSLNEHEYGHADDLPATALHVITDEPAPAQTPFTPGPLLLTGKLSLGNRTEADGRVSTVRLLLDPPTAEQKAAGEQALAAAKKQKAAAPNHHGSDHSDHGHSH